MLSASTARLVEGVATLGESQHAQIKGADNPVPARRLLRMGDRHPGVGRAESNLVAGVGNCLQLKACWTVQLAATARWSAWWGHRASESPADRRGGAAGEASWCRGVFDLL